jgi:uncharacterized delta-60 repeat protein
MSRTEEVYATYDNLVEFNSGYGITYSIIGTGGVTFFVDFEDTTPIGDVFHTSITKIQPDNKVLIYNPEGFSGTSSNLIRIDETGLIDNTFDASGSYISYPSNIVLQPDGKIFVCNDDIYVRLNQDGSQDLYFNDFAPANNILPITNNSHYNTTTSLNEIIKVNTFSGTFSIDNTFGSSVLNNVYIESIGNFNSVVKQTDNKLLFSISATASIVAKGGTFSKGPGVYRLNTDGSFDATFNYVSTELPVSISTGLSNPAGMIIDKNGKIMVPVYYDTSNITFIRLNSNGSVDTSYNFDAPILNNAVTSISIQDDNKMILNGVLVGAADEGIVRYNTDGSIDTTFTWYDFSIKDIVIYDNTDMLAVGTANWPSGRSNISRIDINGAEVEEVSEPLLATGVRMTYTFDDDEVVLNNLYDTPNHIEIDYINNSVTINEIIDEVVVRSPHLIISHDDNFDTANYQIRVWEGTIFDGASQSVLYNITKQKLFLGQDNVYININNLVREKLEANVGNFFSQDYDLAKPLAENMSKWVQIDETLTNAGATVSTSKYRLFATDGYLYNEEEQQVPNILMTGNKRYIYKDQLQRIYFQTNFLTRIEVRVPDGFADYDAYWNVDILGDNKNYVQSLTVDTRYFIFGNEWVEYRFEYSNSETVIVRFNIYDYCKYDPFTLVYKNKWGVLESIGLTKKSSKKLSTTNVDFERSILDYNGSYDINRHTKKQFNVTGNESWTLNTDWMPEYMNQALEEVNLSEEVWLLDKNNNSYPVIMEDSSIDYKTAVNDKLIQYTIKVKLSHNTIKNII